MIGSDDALCSRDIGESKCKALFVPHRMPSCCFIQTFDCTVVLHGPGLRREHCVLENRAGTVTLFPQDGALCSVNGSAVTEPCQLTQGEQFHKIKSSPVPVQ